MMFGRQTFPVWPGLYVLKLFFHCKNFTLTPISFTLNIIIKFTLRTFQAFRCFSQSAEDVFLTTGGLDLSIWVAIKQGKYFL